MNLSWSIVLRSACLGDVLDIIRISADRGEHDAERVIGLYEDGPVLFSARQRRDASVK